MKKLLLTVLILILAFSTIAATLASVNSLKVGDTTSFWSGRAGITFIDSRMSGTVTVTRKDPNKYKVESSPDFIHTLLDVRMVDRNDNKVKFVTGPVYIYYKITNRELRAYDTEGLRLWYFDPWTNEWKKCSTFLVGNGKNGNELGCRIKVFGTYGLGK